MLRKLIVAASFLASTSVFAAVTTVSFSGEDLFGAGPDRTAKVTFTSSTNFDLTGFVDPDDILTFMQMKNSGLYQGSDEISNKWDTFDYAPIVWPLLKADPTRYTFNLQNLVAGTYTLQFNFAGGSHFVGEYTISPNTLPIPEPETYGMMFTGLAFMGLIVLRRLKNS
jgi:hypothetical protein